MEAKDIVLVIVLGTPAIAAALFVAVFFLWLSAVFIKLIAEIVHKEPSE